MVSQCQPITSFSEYKEFATISNNRLVSVLNSCTCSSPVITSCSSGAWEVVVAASYVYEYTCISFVVWSSVIENLPPRQSKWLSNSRAFQSLACWQCLKQQHHWPGSWALTKWQVRSIRPQPSYNKTCLLARIKRAWRHWRCAECREAVAMRETEERPSCLSMVGLIENKGTLSLPTKPDYFEIGDLTGSPLYSTSIPIDYQCHALSLRW